MGKDKKTPITVNDKKYFVEDFNQAQSAAFNHIQDLERKLASAQFNLDQMTVGREAFVKMLAGSLEEVQPEEAEAVN